MSSTETAVERSSSPEYNSSSNVESSDSDGDSKAVAGPSVNPTDLPTIAPYGLTPVTDGSQKKNEYNLTCKLPESTTLVADDTSSTETDVERSLSPERKPSIDVESFDSEGDSKAVAGHAVNPVNPTDCCGMPTTTPYGLTRETDGSQIKRNQFNRHYGLPESTILQAQNLGHTGSSGSNPLNYTLGNSSRDAVNPAGCRMPTTSNFSSRVPYPQIPLSHRWPIPMISALDYLRFYASNILRVQHLGHTGPLVSIHPNSTQGNSSKAALKQLTKRSSKSSKQTILESTAFVTDNTSSPEIDVERSLSPERKSSSDVESSDSDGNSKAVAGHADNPTDCCGMPTTTPYSLTRETDNSKIKRNQFNRHYGLPESTILQAQNLGHTGSSGSNPLNYTLGNSSMDAVNPAGCKMPTTSNFSSPLPYPQIPLSHRWPIPMISALDYHRFYDNLALHNNVSAQNMGVTGYSRSGLPFYPQSNSPVNVLAQPVFCLDYSRRQAASGPAVISAGSGIPGRKVTPRHLTRMTGSQNQMNGSRPNRILRESNMLPAQHLGHTRSLADRHLNSTQGNSSKAALKQRTKRRSNSSEQNILAAALRNRIRRKIKYTTSQLEILEKAFQDNSHPSTIEKEQIAEKIGAEVRCVQRWFRNRRHRGMRNKSNPSEKE